MSALSDHIHTHLGQQHAHCAFVVVYMSCVWSLCWSRFHNMVLKTSRRVLRYVCVWWSLAVVYGVEGKMMLKRLITVCVEQEHQTHSVSRSLRRYSLVHSIDSLDLNAISVCTNLTLVISYFRFWLHFPRILTYTHSYRSYQFHLFSSFKQVVKSLRPSSVFTSALRDIWLR